MMTFKNEKGEVPIFDAQTGKQVGWRKPHTEDVLYYINSTVEDAKPEKQFASWTIGGNTNEES